MTGRPIRVLHEHVTVFAGELDVAGIRLRAGQTLTLHPPTHGLLWERAYVQTRDLPSWERGQAHRRRFEELVKEAGVL